MTHRAGAIAYEICAAISDRVPRRYHAARRRDTQCEDAAFVHSLQTLDGQRNVPGGI